MGEGDNVAAEGVGLRLTEGDTDADADVDRVTLPLPEGLRVRDVDGEYDMHPPSLTATSKLSNASDATPSVPVMFATRSKVTDVAL